MKRFLLCTALCACAVFAFADDVRMLWKAAGYSCPVENNDSIRATIVAYSDGTYAINSFYGSGSDTIRFSLTANETGSTMTLLNGENMDLGGAIYKKFKTGQDAADGSKANYVGLYTDYGYGCVYNAKGKKITTGAIDENYGKVCIFCMPFDKDGKQLTQLTRDDYGSYYFVWEKVWTNACDTVQVNFQNNTYPTHFTMLQKVKGDNQFRIRNFLNSGNDFEFELQGGTYDDKDVTKCNGNIIPISRPLFETDESGYSYFWATNADGDKATNFTPEGGSVAIDQVKFYNGDLYTSANFAYREAKLTLDGTDYYNQGYASFTAYIYKGGAANFTWDNISFDCWVKKDSTPDGIATVSLQDRKQDGTIYDLYGRRVTKPGKGIYIINGKKTVCR